jgi:N utilization substance protein A
MTSSIKQNIEFICKEYDLDRETVIRAMVDAFRAAVRKHFKIQDKTGEFLKVEWNEEEGTIDAYLQKRVVEVVRDPEKEISLEEARELTGGEEVEVDDTLLIPLNTEEMGRIAAQNAKQILIQKLREAVREKIYEEYIDKKGMLVNGVIKRFDRGDIIVDLGNNLEAIIPKKEQVKTEKWNQGERIRAVIVDVTKEAKSPQIVLSRVSEELLKQLFEMEVPEIYDGTVVIKSAVREPGDRAKIAVASNEKDVDPVGACVGLKGSRVQNIIKELRGEKIDIIEWSEEPSVFAANALSPARVTQVQITDIAKRRMRVIVADDQLSLAIGKKGQNVRLATQLVGWNIDIVSEGEIKKEISRQMGEMMAEGKEVPLSVLEGLSANQAEELKKRGIGDIEKVASLTVDDLVNILDISLDDAEKILGSAKSIIAMREEIAKSLKTVDSVKNEEESDKDGEEKSEDMAETEAESKKNETQSGISTKAEV